MSDELERMLTELQGHMQVAHDALLTAQAERLQIYTALGLPATATAEECVARAEYLDARERLCLEQEQALAAPMQEPTMSRVMREQNAVTDRMEAQGVPVVGVPTERERPEVAALVEALEVCSNCEALQQWGGGQGGNCGKCERRSRPTARGRRWPRE